MGSNEMTYIIAEAGTGHFTGYPNQPFNGDGLRFAGGPITRSQNVMRFIDAAFIAGADAVKFQMFVPDEPLFCPLPDDERRMERWRETHLTLEDWRRAQDYAKERHIELLWSAFQPTCIEWLKELKPRYVKVASRAKETFPFWQGSKFLISENRREASPFGPVTTNYDHFYLHCVSKYPAPLAECRYVDDEDHGLSDHSGTIWPGLDVIYHGANFLEVHFKIPGADMGPDEPVCLTVEQLKLLCEARDAYSKMHPTSI